MPALIVSEPDCQSILFLQHKDLYSIMAYNKQRTRWGYGMGVASGIAGQ